jgi:alanine dehydrogenase
MRIGVPREIKADEQRVALTPAGAAALVRDGHSVVVEQGAGSRAGFDDGEYEAAGAELAPDARAVWETAELVVKVKEPLPEEYRYFRPGLVLFTFLHLAAAPELTRALMARGVTAIGYETVERDDGQLPLLMPMSEVAGRMAPQIGAHFLERPHGGRGILLGGVPGVAPGHVVILGGGVVGSNAARIAVGLGARVTLLDVDAVRLRTLDDLFGGRLETLMSETHHIAQAVADADLLIGAVLVHGARAPHLVTAEMVRTMRPGSVIVDVAVDQGGTVETVDHTTTHSDPIYVRHGVVHYAVPNMPGAVPRTSTLALANVTLPYVRALAAKGPERALREDRVLRRGLNTYRGSVTCRGVAEAHGLTYVPPDQALT